jgi:small subunit ribosomal protein S8
MKAISEFLNQIINAQKIGANSVVCMHSKKLDQILNILTEEGFIRGFFKKKIGSDLKCCVLLKYISDHGAIQNVCLMSRPSLKSFKKHKQLSKSLNGARVLIMSTNRGIITNEQAFFQKVGGQCLFRIC